jgi:heme-degrading monooxygenase HmoA
MSEKTTERQPEHEKGARQRTAPEGAARASGPVTLINSFQVLPSRDEAFRALWGETSRYFTARPGFVSLRLHRAINDDAPYRWVNVAVWESESAFRSAHATEEFRNLVTASPWSEFPSLPTLFQVETEAEHP